MKSLLKIALSAMMVLALHLQSFAQAGAGPGAYCFPLYSNTPCNQPGPSNSNGNSVNDFIDIFQTSGANVNISNVGSGCNAQSFSGVGTRNYFFHGCENYMVATPGQVITCTLQSGIIYSQGFAIFVDWNQDNIFNMPSEQVAATAAVPAAATPTVLTFTIPSVSNGTYRLRVRCAYFTNGPSIDPCNIFSFGETEDYLIYIGPPPPGIITGTASATSPVCANQNFSLNVVISSTVPTTYTWTGPGNYTSTTQNPVVSGATPTMSGTYTVTVANGACPLTTTTSVNVIPLPSYTVSPQTTTVCQNGSFIVAATATNAAMYTYQWSGALSFGSPNGASTYVNTYPISTPTALVIYSVIVTPTVLNCPLTTTLSVRINNPPTPTLTMPPPLCNNSTITSVSALPPGGTWYGNQIVASNGIVSPANATVFGTLPVCYSITVGTCTASNCSNISISKFNTAAFTGTITPRCVQDPTVNLMSIASNTQGTWSGVGVSGNLFNPTGLPTNTYLLNYFNPSTPYPNVCPATGSITVAVFNPPTPTVAVAAVCSSITPVQLTALPGGGVWSGNSGISASGLFTPSLSANTAGVNSVTYTAGQGTCVAASSTTFTVYRFHSAALLTGAMSLCSTTNPVNLMTLVTSTVSGAWSSPYVSYSPYPYTFDPAGRNTGTYTAVYNTVSTPVSNTCSDSRTLQLYLLKPDQPGITPIGPVCNADAPIQLSVSPATGSFIPSAYLSSTGVFTPSLSTVGQNQVQYVIGTSTCNLTDTRLINVEAFVPATILGSIASQCNTSPAINLLPLTANNQGIWSGPGVLGASFNPANSGTGVIDLVYSTSSSPSGLCPDNQTLAVNVYSLASPAIALAGPYCNSHAPVRLTVSPLGGVFGSTSMGAVDPSGWFNPAYADIGDNIVSYSVASGPCLAYTQATIKIEKFISADFNKYVGPYCKNDPAIDLNSIAQNPGGQWAGPGVTGSMFDPSQANVGSSNIINYRTHSPTEELCPDTSAMRIQINDVPKVAIVRDIESGCEPVEVTFNTPSANTGRGEWNFGDGSANDPGLSTTHTYTAPGTYSVAFRYWDEIGCSTETVLTNAVIVYEVPKAAFTYNPYDQVTIADPLVQFINQTPNLGNNSYTWQIADLYTSTEVNPTALFSKAGSYRIDLTATTTEGCKDQASKIIIVEPDFNVFVPNSFTPNFDGLNDTFIPVFSTFGLDPKSFEMEIFDRWGAQLYSTKDITKGWDGTIQNKGSEPLKQDVYVYKIKYRDLEGKAYSQLGHVTLLR